MSLTVKKLSYKLVFQFLTITLVVFYATRVIAVSEDENLNRSVPLDSFLNPLSNLNNEELDQFILGKSFFRIPWVEAPSATSARDGLGPLFNANTCLSCHKKNGRGKVFQSDNVVSRSNIFKLSIPNNKSLEHIIQIQSNGIIEEPNYGSQININAATGVEFEGKPNIDYQYIPFTYPDGNEVTLRKPFLKLTHLNYGELNPNTFISSRIASPLIGLGLIEQISDAQILENEDIDDINGDGISGKANRVWSRQTNKFEIGKYTWKASSPSIKHQVANAALNDMGLTNPIYPLENCTQRQDNCLNAPKGKGDFDLTPERLDAMSFYLTHLKIPSSVSADKFGAKLFDSIGCSGCHKASYEINEQRIYPYSDFLLHDMGSDLSDKREEFSAKGSEWRTAPLWFTLNTSVILGEDKNFLHDGRARTIEEAILWHGGEAKKSKELFINLSHDNRLKIINFVNQI